MNYDQLLEKLRHDLPVAAHLPPWATLAIYGVLLLVAMAFVLSSWFTVHTQSFRIVERFGKYHKTASAGLHFKLPLIDSAHTEWTLQITQHIVKVETITSDKVTVVLVVPVQYNTIVGREADAFYKLDDETERITSVVFDVVRSEIPKLTLDQVFASKETLAQSVQGELRKDMLPFGFEINRVMVTEIEPDKNVKHAMNEINAAQKQGEAELAKAHNEQLVQVARAKGRLEASTLNKQAEIIDAEAVAKSVEIIGHALHENTGYLQWKWIHMMEERDSGDTIYVPTEAGLPILEAMRRAPKPSTEE